MLLPFMQVATLSTGPVGPSDSLGHMNHDLVMRTCAADGLILKPDKPATPLDAVFEQGFANASAARVCKGARHLHTEQQEAIV